MILGTFSKVKGFPHLGSYRRRDGEGNTVLSRAAAAGRVDALKCSLQADGVLVNTRNFLRNTPLIEAAKVIAHSYAYAYAYSYSYSSLK
jgi:hypothetical protein